VDTTSARPPFVSPFGLEPPPLAGEGNERNASWNFLKFPEKFPEAGNFGAARNRSRDKTILCVEQMTATGRRTQLLAVWYWMSQGRKALRFLQVQRGSRSCGCIYNHIGCIKSTPPPNQSQRGSNPVRCTGLIDKQWRDSRTQPCHGFEKAG